MYQGKRVARRSRRSSKKPWAVLVSLALLVTAVLGVTVAWLTTNTDPVVNTFQPAQVSCEIIESFNGDKTAKESVKIKNTSDVDAYLRVAVIANYVDEQGNIQAGVPEIAFQTAAGWTKGSDGYYYYQTAAIPGQEIEFLANSMSLPDGVQVTILADAIQATDAAVTAAGWQIN